MPFRLPTENTEKRHITRHSLDQGGVWTLIYCILVDIMTGYYLPQCVCNGSTASSQASQDQSADKQICRVLHHALQQTR